MCRRIVQIIFFTHLLAILSRKHYHLPNVYEQRDARRRKGSSEAKRDSPYDMEDILMPLHEFIDEPIVHDIVHNGATFQVILN